MLQSGPNANWRFVGPIPPRILLTPSCLRPADPLLARDYYQGRFTFAGRTVETGNQSPFLMQGPSPAWEADLHSFRWLRHLADAGTDLAAAQARALIEDWIAIHGKRARPPAFAQDVTASRLIAWLQHSRFVLTGSDHGFYRRFMTSLARQRRYLRSALRGSPESIDTLHATIALAICSLCLPTSGRRQRRLADQLERLLKRQILPDGGHESRNRGHLPHLLADLLPLTQCYLSASKPVPQEVIRAIDRMFPQLRAARHVDGQIALFHGAGFSHTDLNAAVLRLDRTEGAAPTHAPQSGYFHVHDGPTTLIADVGMIPHGRAGSEAHASALAFEFSSGRQRIVTNLGVERLDRQKYRTIAQSTAAHNTVTIGDVSSARFRQFAGIDARYARRCVGGPGVIDFEAHDSGGTRGFVASHDGYARRFNLLHERGISLSHDGRRIDGFDRLVPVGRAKPKPVAAVARFHFHPAIVCQPTTAQNTFLLTSDTGERWAFRAIGAPAVIEESLFLAGVAGPAPTWQIRIDMDWPDVKRVSWRFERLT